MTLRPSARLRSSEACSRRTFTWFSRKEEVVELSRLWNVPILVKPFDFDALFEAIA